MYDEAMASHDADLQAADREREYVKREHQEEPRFIVKDMMGKDYALFFEDERHAKHLWDANHGL